MLVKEYLFSADLSAKQLSEMLGYKTVGTVTRKLDDEMPLKWTRKLEEMAESGTTIPNPDSPTGEEDSSGNPSERESKISDDDINAWISSEGREDDKDPNINNINSGVEVIGPQQIKLTTIKGYVEMVYSTAESIAASRGDLIAAETISRYKPQYIEAWMDYIKYDPRILKYLEMLNIGTPIGNLVGIHAVSIGAYVLARVTARELARNIAADSNGEVEI
jgi:hypothetical protein